MKNSNLLSLACTFLTVILNAIFTSACPNNCYCKHFNVDCSETELREIPSGIPSQTQILNLQDNQIELVSASSLRHLTSLRKLVLSSNKIVTVEDGSFDNLPNLTTLYMSSNRIQQLNRGIFSSLRKLNDLDLSHNRLSDIDGIFDNLTKLHRIDLSYNLVKKLTKNSFRDVNDLRFFMMPDNNISFISPDTFKNLKNLSYVSLRHNLLTNVDGVFKKNKFLTYIELSECKLSKFPKNLPLGIQYLHLSQNNISRLTKKDLKPYTKMVILILDQNQLTSIEDAAFARMDVLTELWLNMNKLKDLPSRLPQDLKVLQITGNHIMTLKDGVFAERSKLEILSLQSNAIQMIERHMFQNIPNLKRLYLGGNTFTVLKDLVFSDLQNLEFLSLSTIDLDYIGADAFSGLENLSELEMQYIQTAEEAIQGNFFQHLKNLRILDLQHSQDLAHQLISAEESLSSLSSLTELNIMDNGITTLDKTFMQLLPHLTLVKIHGNKFHCDKRLVWFRNWIKVEDDKFFIPSNIECNTPVSLNGMSLMKVPVAQFVPTTHRSNSIDIPMTMPITVENLDVSSTADPVKVIETTEKAMVTKDKSKDIKTGYVSSTEKSVTNTQSLLTKETTTSETEKFITTTSKQNKLPTQAQPTKSISDIGITAITAAVTVTIICILLAIVLFILCKRQRDLIYHRAMKYEGENDVFTVSMVPPDERIQGPTPGRYTREDRGSVTSKPGEDITNDIESKMKVYTIDDNRS